MKKQETKSQEVNEQILDEGQLEQVSGGQDAFTTVKIEDLPDSPSKEFVIVGIPGHIA